MSKKKISREELFESSPVYNAIFILTIPMIISSIVSMVYNLSDTYFVGVMGIAYARCATEIVMAVVAFFVQAKILNSKNLLSD